MSLPDARVECSLSNERDAFSNVARWDLRKRVDGAWFDPFGRWTVRDRPSVAPDDSTDWAFDVDNADLARVVESVAGHDVTCRGLGGGTYAFLVSGSYGAEDERFVENTPWLAYPTEFSLRGDPLPLEATSNVLDVRRNEDAVVVRTTDEEPDWAVTASTREDAPTARSDAARHRFITEQLYGRPLLRDVLAQFEDGVEEVVVETSLDDGKQATSPLRMGDTVPVTYDGVDYAVSSNPV